jgi:hypothetical protein
MNLFKMQPRYSRTTGKPIKPKLTAVGWICDFCGEPHVPGADAEYCDSVVSYVVRELEDSELEFHECEVEGYPVISH